VDRGLRQASVEAGIADLAQNADRFGRPGKSLNADGQTPDPANFDHAVNLIGRVCGLAGSLSFIDDIQADLRRDEIADAVKRHNTPKIFDWLLTAFSYQGISDQVAREYIRKHGNATWSAVSADLDTGRPPPACPLLRTYWHFDGCRYDKGSFSCSHPEHIDTCPLPSHRLRNGRLNQTAYSFFLFARDIAKGDLIGWLDDRLNTAPAALGRSNADFAIERQERLIGPLRNVYGVSDKILTMTLSGLLLGASDGRPHWFETGKGMIAIDTLVHNFLHRTGILDHCGASHAYGAGCYGHGGCAEIIRAAASRIDASAFNRRFPRVFPRFVQHAIWRFCAADGLNTCNGNRIDDRKSCENRYCQMFSKCDRKALKSQ
jgi:hypothetical protein